MADHYFGSEYSDLEDDEFLALESEKGELLPEAKAALAHQIRNRNLKSREPRV
jgi:hypothetical protein